MIDIEHALDIFKPGIYQHYKGKKYLALGLAQPHGAAGTDDTYIVVYVPLYEAPGARMRLRSLLEFLEFVPAKDLPASMDPTMLTRRFEYIGQIIEG